jgi:PqqD family protein of HPr-rel-A system
VSASASADPAAPLTRYIAAAGLRFHDFGDLCAVFDPLSWDVHLLNPAAVGVLELVSSGPRTIDELEAFLADALLPDERRQAHDHAIRLTADLVSLGLVHSLCEQQGALR